MKEGQSSVINLLSKVEISKIQLISSEFAIHVPPELLTTEMLKYNFDHLFSHLYVPAENENMKSQLLCFVQVTVRSAPIEGSDKNGKKEFAFAGACKFVVRYIVENNIEVSENLLKEFTSTFSLAHSYPYIRNHVESQFNQMDLLGVILPLYKSGPWIPLKDSITSA